MAIRIVQTEAETQKTRKPIKAPPEKPVEAVKPSNDIQAPKKRGLGSMSVEKAREIQSKGGASVTKEKRHFSTNPDKAREAGKKGGMAKSNKGKSNDKAI